MRFQFSDSIEAQREKAGEEEVGVVEVELDGDVPAAGESYLEWTVVAVDFLYMLDELAALADAGAAGFVREAEAVYDGGNVCNEVEELAELVAVGCISADSPCRQSRSGLEEVWLVGDGEGLSLSSYGEYRFWSLDESLDVVVGYRVFGERVFHFQLGERPMVLDGVCVRKTDFAYGGEALAVADPVVGSPVVERCPLRHHHRRRLPFRGNRQDLCAREVGHTIIQR